MPVAMPLPARIAQSASKSVKQRLLSAQFGDGYFTSAPDGINSIFEEWSVSWEGVPLADRNTIVAALLTAATDTVAWTPPGEAVEKKYQIKPNKVAELYSEAVHPGMFFSIAASFVQVR